MGVIYRILNTVNNKAYIGSSKNVKKRWRVHVNTLKRKLHHNIYLQRSWIKYGESSFNFSVIEGDILQESLLERERFWIKELTPEYNIGGVGGGDNFTNHPNKERLREVCRRNLQKLRDEGRTVPVGRGSKNPNWRGGISGEDLCSCGEVKKVKSKLCKKCNDQSRIGRRNPFYGKRHTEATKAKQAKEKQGVELKKLQKSLVGDGIFYTSCKQASESLGVARGTITYRLKSKNYPSWFLTDDQMK